MRDLFVAAGANVELTKSGGGVFEITIGGELRFSKKQIGRFPTAEEVSQLLP